uniref:Interleukin-6 n=1 Tax=Rattus norvegicus TaxID=10116 RepID=A0A8I6AGT8_RAT
MKFLSARDFQPVAFLGLMLLTATAFPTSQVRRGDFTEDTTHNRPVYTTSQVGGLITYVLREILEMRKELCNGNSDCMNSDDALSENNLKLPEIQRNDGCFQTGYNQEICLLKICSGLLEFRFYLEFVKNNLQDNKKDKARVIQSNTETLVHIFKQEVSASPSLMQCREEVLGENTQHLRVAALFPDSCSEGRSEQQFLTVRPCFVLLWGFVW